MFQKVHVRLTLLFSVAAVLILTVMSVFYLYTSQKSLYQNALLSFQSDVDTFTVSFEKRTSVSYDWLLHLQENYDYLFYLYDNDVPFRFTEDTKSDREKQLIENIRSYYVRHVSPMEIGFTTVHQEFLYQPEDCAYYVSVIRIPGESSSSEIFVVNALSRLQAQLYQLYFRFGAAVLAASAVLFVFSWFYTKKLLLPIQESQEKQTQFVAAASHEIRNPVNTILAALDVMDRGTDVQKQEFISIARKEGRRLASLTNDLLTLAESDHQNFRTSFGKTELDTILLDCYEAFSAPAQKKHIRLLINLPDDAVIAAHMDGERVRQVISILLDNAISYTPEYGNVTLGCMETAKSFRIEVADDGIGMDDTVKEKIFDRFYRVDDSRTSKAHFGLGLSIAKEIVALHRGTITVSDAQGGGTVFTVKLPK